MGHIFSRALKRLTQSGGSQEDRRSSSSQERKKSLEDQTQESAQNLHQQVRPQASGESPHVQSIPVGQSIDSAEYAALKGPMEANQSADNSTDGPNLEAGKTEPKQGVNQEQSAEVAATKIQALVRGHLTRKALKDQQTSLGQRQFAPLELVKEPLSAVFSSDSPLTLKRGSQDQEPQVVKSLEPIVEQDDELGGKLKELATEQTTASASQRAKLTKQTVALRPETPPVGEMRGSLSPVPSEANASIDLGTCDTPISASVSIDLGDYNQQPADKMAAVLHHKAAERAVESRGADTPDSLDSLDSAAIRIQSAFRGYRTRKNSPYRTRSPPQSLSKESSTAPAESQQPPVERLGGQLSEQPTTAPESEGRRVGGERRASRNKLREPSIPEQEPANLDGCQLALAEAPSVATSFSGDARDQCQRQTSGCESLAEQLTVGGGESLMSQLMASDTLDGAQELASSAAQIGSSMLQDSSVSGEPGEPRRKSTSAKSEDTDSSILGAALSFNEPDEHSSALTSGHQESMAAGATATDLPRVSLTAEELESEARRLVDEMLSEEPTEPSATISAECALEPDVDEGAHRAEGRAPEPALQGAPSMEDQAQLAVELESDDIERRDPKGDCTEERARSPQIKLEQPTLAEPPTHDQPTTGAQPVNGSALAPDEAGSRSVSAANSSADEGADDASDSADDEVGRANEGQPSPSGDSEAQAKRQQQTGSRNKNRRQNRHKKKGKK